LPHLILDIGGIAAGILRTRGRQRLAELVMRERIAAIERGIDPTKLPPMPVVDDPAVKAALAHVLAAAGLPQTPRRAELQKAQAWLTTGAILLAAGLGLGLMLLILTDASAHRAWAAGLLPAFIGIAAIIASVIVRKGAPADDRTPGTPSA
jgi:hypothetical protein